LCPQPSVTIICTMSKSFHVNLSYSGSVVLEGKKIQWTHQMFAYLWLSCLWRRSRPLFVQFKIPFTQGSFVPSLIEIGLLVLEIFLSIQTHNIMNMFFPIVAPPDPLGTMVWTNMNLQVRKLSCKYDWFWLSCSWKEDFQMTSPHFFTLWLSPLWTGSGPIFEQFTISYTQGWFLPSFIWMACWFWRRCFSI
jgi:hypothetical protein